jgi:purine-binding chemotaxis protein CheW
MAEKKEQSANPLLQLVIFKIGEEEFGVEITRVKEIIRLQPITRIPRTPDFLEGVINLRGKIIPVVDLRRRLGLPPKEPDKKTRIIVIEEEDRMVGFLVDAVTEVLRIPDQTTELPPNLKTGIDRSFITSIGILDKRLIILLDLNKVFTLEEEEQLEQVVEHARA